MQTKGWPRTGRLIILAGLLAVGARGLTAAPAGSEENPYLVAVERNMFDLKPMPRPEENVPPPPPPPPTKITLQGITVLFGRKEVLLKIPESPAPGQPPQERSLILGEGERHGPIEVVRIDPVTREVEFRDSGNPVTLKLTDFIVKTPVAATPTPTPGGVRPAAPGATRPVPPPTASLPQPGTAGVAAPANVAMPATTANPPMPQFPSRPVRTLPANAVPPTVTQPQAQQPQLSLEEQILLIELQRQATQDKVMRGELPPLPPTELTPHATGTDAHSADPHRPTVAGKLNPGSTRAAGSGKAAWIRPVPRTIGRVRVLCARDRTRTGSGLAAHPRGSYRRCRAPIHGCRRGPTSVITPSSIRKTQLASPADSPNATGSPECRYREVTPRRGRKPDNERSAPQM